MARGRKSTKIKTIKTTEKNALKCLWRTGVATKSQLKEHFNLHGDRLQKFKNSGYIKMNNDIIQLNKEGEKYCEKLLGMRYRYTPAINHLSHDLRITHAYLHLSPEVQETWKTENEIFSSVKNRSDFEDFKKDTIKEYGNYKATPDAAIISPETGEYIGFECITSNYSESDIQQKTSFCNHFFSGIHRF